MTKRVYPRDVLNRLKWEDGKSLDRAEVVVLHRGAQDNKKVIPGKEIVRIGQMFFETTETAIPYHRILEIRYNGETIFKRRVKEK